MIRFKEEILNYIEENRKEIINISHAIHKNPEIGNEEFFASKLLSEKLEANGFCLERDISGHKTGFIATYRSKKEGPSISYLAEYDALPELGHACGHNIIGTLSVYAAIALSKIIDNIGGVVQVFGTPAEEGGVNGSAKASYVKTGKFKNTDVAMMIHPCWNSYTTLKSTAVDVFEVEYFGRQAHAGANPSEGINALDAMLQFYNGVNAMRQQIKDSDRIHGIILNGGQAPNIIPDYTKARFFTRSAKRKDLDVLTEKVRKIAEGAALQTSCKVKFSFIQNGVDDFNLNKPFDELYKKIATQLGDNIINEQANFGSTDAGNVSQVIPTIHSFIKIGPENLIPHTVEFREAAISPMADEALILGAKILALVGKELLKDKNKLTEIKKYFEDNKI